MRVLIYEPLPDINRAPIIAAIAEGLTNSGHEVLLLLEEQLIYTLHNSTKITTIDCRRTLRSTLPPRQDIIAYLLQAPASLYKLTDQQQAIERIRELREEQYSQLIQHYKPESTFIWNGSSNHLKDFMAIAHAQSMKNFYFMECGWFPQKGTVYFDSAGVNALSTIAKKTYIPLNQDQDTRLDNWVNNYLKDQQRHDAIKGRIFVPLQVDTDTNIALYSPFKSMKEFIHFLEGWLPKECQVILRPHPLGNYAYQIASNRSNFSVDSTTNLNELIDSCELTIGINSTVLLETLLRERPIIALGDGILGKAAIAHKDFSQNPITTYSNEKARLYSLVFDKQQFIKGIESTLRLTMGSKSAKRQRYKVSIRRRSSLTFSRIRIWLYRIPRVFQNSG